MEALKKPTTIDEQIELLRSRGILIDNYDSAYAFLKNTAYYKVSAYLLPFKTSPISYKVGTKYSQIIKIFEFDSHMRNLFLFAIEKIELSIKSTLSYYHVHKYGPLGYIDRNNFSTSMDSMQYTAKILELIRKNETNPDIKHHLENYGEIPFWVMVDYFSLGTVSRFYSDMKLEDQKGYLRSIDLPITPAHYASWLKCLTELRNRCAHYSRLYYWRFHSGIKFTQNMQKYHQLSNRSLFSQILLIKLLYHDDHLFNENFVYPFKMALETYSEYIEFRHLGFPGNYNDFLNMDVNDLLGAR